jgi:hypothetical protein
MAFEPDLFLQRRDRHNRDLRPDHARTEKRFLPLDGGDFGPPFYWDPSEGDVSEDVTVWLSETEEEVVDDETLPFE